MNCLLDIISRTKRELTDTQFWQTAFLRQGLFIRKNQHEPNYWLILGTLPDNLVAILWPAEKLKVEGSTKVFLIPSASVKGKQHLNLASCFSIKTWRVVPTQVWSPMHAFIAKCKGLPPLCHFQTGKEVPLLEYAAQNAFWNVKTRYLKRLRKDGRVTLHAKTMLSWVVTFQLVPV